MITRQFKGTLVHPAVAGLNADVDCTLTYDHETDPITVAVKLDHEGQESITWMLDREYLNTGRMKLSAYGQGDVKLKWAPRQNALAMCLHNPTGHAHIVMPWDEVAEFMNETLRAVPIGDEDTGAQVDDAIARLLA